MIFTPCETFTNVRTCVGVFRYPVINIYCCAGSKAIAYNRRREMPRNKNRPNLTEAQKLSSMPQYAEWLTQSERYSTVFFKKVMHKRENAHLLAIDRLVAKFESQRTQRIPLLYAISRACCTWLEHKHGRKSVRRTAVMRLIKTALYELEDLGFERPGISNTAKSWAEIDQYLKSGLLRSKFRRAMDAQKRRIQNSQDLMSRRFRPSPPPSPSSRLRSAVRIVQLKHDLI